MAISNTRHCRDCGNPDCPNVSPHPYYERCPATFDLAPEQELCPESGEPASEDWRAA